MSENCHYALLGRCGHYTWLNRPNIWTVLSLDDDYPPIDIDSADVRYRDGVAVRSKRRKSKTITMRHLECGKCDCSINDALSVVNVLACTQCAGDKNCFSTPDIAAGKFLLCPHDNNRPGYTDCRLVKFACGADGRYREYAIEVELSAIRKSKLSGGCVEREIEFLAPYPYWHVRKQSVLKICPKVLNQTFCDCFGRYSFSHCVDVPYSGHVDSYPVFSFTGIQNFTVSSPLTGETFLVGGASDDESLTVDFGRKTITASSGRDTSAYISVDKCWTGIKLAAGCGTATLCISGNGYKPGVSNVIMSHWVWYGELP